MEAPPPLAPPALTNPTHPTVVSWVPSLIAGLVFVLLSGCSSVQRTESRLSAPTRTHRVPKPLLDEISGLAPSNRSDAYLWAINDSGDTATFYAFSQAGRPLGRITLENVHAVDWEDMASFTYKGESWLMAADTGDNLALRKDPILYFVHEPRPDELRGDRIIQLNAVRSLPLHFKEGPFDCEAVGVAADEEKIFLISKKTIPARLYVLPLALPAGSSPVEPRWVADLEYLPQPTFFEELLPLPTGKYKAQPTGLSFSPDGRHAALLTYSEVWLYTRSRGNSWEQVLTKPGQRLPQPHLFQAESICFSRDGRRLYVATEGSSSELLCYDLSSL